MRATASAASCRHRRPVMLPTTTTGTGRRRPTVRRRRRSEIKQNRACNGHDSGSRSHDAATAGVAEPLSLQPACQHQCRVCVAKEMSGCTRALRRLHDVNHTLVGRLASALMTMTGSLAYRPHGAAHRKYCAHRSPSAATCNQHLAGRVTATSISLGCSASCCISHQQVDLQPGEAGIGGQQHQEDDADDRGRRSSGSG